MVLDLTHYYGLIQVRGEQAKGFLQGQLTCDVTKIDAKSSCLGAYCDHKGRVLADFRLYQAEQGVYYLLLHQSLVDLVIAQLKKYAIFSKVAVENHSDLFMILGYLAAGAAEETLTDQDIQEKFQSKHLFIIPIETSTPPSLPGFIPKSAGNSPRFLFLLPKKPGIDLSILDLPNHLIQSINLTGQVASSHWQQANILAGIPTVYAATSGLFTPHQINFHLINGVSFSKGCFLGQEVIARTQHLGKSKRLMVRMQIQTADRPKPGDPVFDGEAIVGAVVDASPDFNLETGYQLLAVINDKIFTTRPLTLEPHGAEILNLQSLAYQNQIV